MLLLKHNKLDITIARTQLRLLTSKPRLRLRDVKKREEEYAPKNQSCEAETRVPDECPLKQQQLFKAPCLRSRRCYVEAQISYVTGFENEKPPSAFVSKNTYTHGVRICSPKGTNVTDKHKPHKT